MKVWFLSGEMNEDSNMFIESEIGREYPFRNPLYFKVESTTPVDPAGGLSLIHISEPRDLSTSRMPSSA